MGFEGLLGNARLKENLSASIGRGHISHFYLISGPKGSGKKTLAKLLAAAILCTGGDRPCGSCPACRKVVGNGHPDFITVDDPEKKTVPVELVRKARADMYIQPNESDYKIYLFPRAQDMEDPSQNALLKVLEEPPSYGVFILLTNSPEKLLPTVRSRCTELALTALPEDVLRTQLKAQFPKAAPERIDSAMVRSGGYLGQAIRLLKSRNTSEKLTAFADSYIRRDPVALLQVLVPMEKWKREMLVPELELWLQTLQSALSCRSGMAPISTEAQQISAARSGSDLMKAIQTLKKVLEYAQRNVSVGAICGYLEWELR